MFSMNSKSFQSSILLAIVQGESCTIANSLNYFELLLRMYIALNNFAVLHNLTVEDHVLITYFS